MTGMSLRPFVAPHVPAWSTDIRNAASACLYHHHHVSGTVQGRRHERVREARGRCTGTRHLSAPERASWQHGKPDSWPNRVVSHPLFQAQGASTQPLNHGTTTAEASAIPKLHHPSRTCPSSSQTRQCSPTAFYQNRLTTTDTLQAFQRAATSTTACGG